MLALLLTQLHQFSFKVSFFIFLAVLSVCCWLRPFLQLRQVGATLLWCVGFSMQWLLLLQGSSSMAQGLQPLVGSTAPVQQLRCPGFVAPSPVGSSQTRDPTPVPCIDRWILNHWTTREVTQLSSSRDLVKI